MDWTIPLKTQQKDLCQRMRSGHLLLCDIHSQYGEVTVITGDELQQLIESCQKAFPDYDQISCNYLTLRNYFHAKLGEAVFKYRFSDLVTKFINEDLKHYKINFILDGADGIHLQVKTSYGKVEDAVWWFSKEEVEQNSVLVCILALQDFKPIKDKYELILAGFLPTELIESNEDQICLHLDQLLYAGGLRGYLNHFKCQQQNYITLAKKYNHKGDYFQAIAIYNQALEANSQNPKIYLLRGIAWWKIGDLQRALQDCNEALKINNSYDLAYHWRGYLHCQLKNYREAIEDYSEEIKINPVSAYAYYRRGFVNSLMKNHSSALDDYSNAVTVNANLYQAFYGRGNTFYQLGDRQDAIDDYSQALKLNPNLVQAYYNRAIMKADLGYYQEAIADYQEAIKINCNYAKAYYNLAILQADLGNYQSAVHAYNRVIEIDPHFIQAKYNRRALIYYLTERNHILGTKEDHQTQNAQVKKFTKGHVLDPKQEQTSFSEQQQKDELLLFNFVLGRNLDAKYLDPNFY